MKYALMLTDPKDHGLQFIQFFKTFELAKAQIKLCDDVWSLVSSGESDASIEKMVKDGSLEPMANFDKYGEIIPENDTNDWEF